MKIHLAIVFVLYCFIICTLVAAEKIPLSGSGTTAEDVVLQSSKSSALEEADLFITGGIVVNAHEAIENGDVLVSSKTGKILAVGRGLRAPDGARIIDAKGKYVMPGGIDPHTHMEMPFMGTVSADDFYTGTRAALAGGTTMIIDFAGPWDGESHYQAYLNYRKKADPKVCSDYALHMAIFKFDDETAKDMEKLTKELGVINSYKFFLTYGFRVNDEQMFNGFRHAASLGAISMVHAENHQLVTAGQKRILEAGLTGPGGHGLSRPPAVEAEATHRAITLAHFANAPLYVVHVMSKPAMEEVERAKLAGYRVVGEPVIGGLTLDDSKTFDDDFDVAAGYIMSPPLRPRSGGHQVALQNALRAGILDLVATDHCSFTIKQKRMGKDDFTKIPNGIPTVEDRLNVLWDEMVRTGKITPQRFVEVTSTNAAKIFNIYPQKGSISAGADADIILLDPKAKKVISDRTDFMATDYNAYEGKEIEGHVVMTISRGKVVYENGKLNVEKGAGRFIPTPPGGIMFEGLDMEAHAARKPAYASTP